MFTLPKLPYAFDALEPHIDAKTMEIHHDKHHQGYVDKLNAALEGHEDLQNLSVEELLMKLDSVPEDIRTAVRNNGGGHANHSMFWTIMSPDGGGEPSGALAEAITKTFGDFASFKKQFSETAAGQFGSGWGWLGYGKDGLHLHSLPNQDSPLLHGDYPVMGVDVWEHAYYLNYQNKRADYLEAWWNVVNWNAVEERFQEAKSD